MVFNVLLFGQFDTSIRFSVKCKDIIVIKRKIYGSTNWSNGE